jgi:cell wall-associated NlpC family hydrolase
MIWKKPSCVILVFAAFFVFSANVFGQVYSRPRVVPTVPVPAPTTATTNPATNRQTTTAGQVQTNQKTVMQRPTLTNDVVVVNQNPIRTAPPQPLVKKTVDSKPVTPPSTTHYASTMLNYSATMNQRMLLSIQEKLGIRYVYGTEGPNSFDCSGFVWSVFQTAGIPFERGSARTLWANSIPVSEEEKYKFGTLVFFNGLGHVGIVADENGFYHASRSKGITYSPFAGYWGKRIVGFRRLPNKGF